MRMAGRFSRRVRGAAKARGIPVIDCRRKEKKHQLAEDYLATHAVKRGVFLILVARAVAPIWEVARSARGVIHHLTKKLAYVNPSARRSSSMAMSTSRARRPKCASHFGRTATASLT